MNIRKLIAPAMLGPVLLLGACAENYAVEGAAVGAAAGAAVGAIAGEDVLAGAAIGAAAGAVAGAFVDRDNDCGGYDRDGRLDDDCYDRDGYPRRPRR